MLKNDRSVALFEKAKNFFPGGVNSPVRAFRSVGGTPLFIKKGKGAYIWDADDNKYIDYCCSWGPLILGHANDVVLKPVNEVMQNGTSFGAPTELENKLAELIISNHKFIEKIRFVSSGTEAVMSAIRLARGYTKRNKIIKFEGCFHGHADSVLVKAGSGLVTFGNTSSAGVPQSFVNETLVVKLDNETAVEQAFKEHGNDIACIIIEPIPANNGLLLQRKEFLQFLRDICIKNGSLLIFDEVISGFRIGFEGAAGYYDIKPDIMTFGKIIGGGFPVGMYASSKEIMSSISPEGNVYQAGTLSGNPVAMAAGIAQLGECLKPNFYLQLEEKTKKLCEGISNVFKNKNWDFRIFQIGSIFWMSFSKQEYVRNADEISTGGIKRFNELYHKLHAQGIYFGPSGYEVGFVSSALSNEDIEATIKAFEKAIA
ncbi:MAG TPA: glutamate-1-semialdehyde 2,1-aminomutase [Bacteroidia bacterium]|jgi:glutamate-1-semialdehyde 2,1-aminomutase|nr:glutamate-1-semialdehyde 2,1-aminomutase [Bacteroidia bacterium]